MATITLSRQRHGLLVECLAACAEPVARSPRFTIYDLDVRGPAQSTAPDPDDIVLVHDFTPIEIDNNIGRFVAEELVPLFVASSRSGAADRYAVSEQDIFERFVGEVVRSMDGNERHAWNLFYDNTLTALNRTERQERGTNGGNASPQDYIADFAAIYQRAAELVAEVAPATLFDAATCFGFLPLLFASGAWPGGTDIGRPRNIVACDINPALVSLAEGYARQRRLLNVRFVRADLLADDLAHELAPLEPSFDVVTAIHFLEHLEREQTISAVDALWSLAARRLIVAVPIEEFPNARFGHRQVFNLQSLSALGQRIGGMCRCFEDHGAWLVIDRATQQGSCRQ